MFCESKDAYESRSLVLKGALRVFFFSFCIEPILEQPRMGPFWRVSVNRDDPQARLPPVEAILFLPRATHARTMRTRARKAPWKEVCCSCAARVLALHRHPTVACGVRLDRSLP